MKSNLCLTLGIGVIISAILMGLSYTVRFEFLVEREARRLGMVYPSEIKVLENEP